MYAVVSDIHGNLTALKAVTEDMKKFDITGIICLGDLIDYGMQSNEVVEFVKVEWSDKLICSLWGNHENAILTSDFNHFSSERGVQCAKYTASVLSGEAMDYLEKTMIHEGICEFLESGYKILALHGSLNNIFWKSVEPEDVKGDYRNYDIVLSGHSHYSHIFTKFYASDNHEKRNKHSVLFINPGSVGQPRNHNPFAQYALIDLKSRSVSLRAVEYDVEKAMSLYNGCVDDFYRIRLKNGV